MKPSIYLGTGGLKDTPKVYQNFYNAVLSPALYSEGRYRPVQANDYLEKFNAQWNYRTGSIEFDTENDMILFMLKWA